MFFSIFTQYGNIIYYRISYVIITAASCREVFSGFIPRHSRLLPRISAKRSRNIRGFFRVCVSYPLSDREISADFCEL